MRAFYVQRCTMYKKMYAMRVMYARARDRYIHVRARRATTQRYIQALYAVRAAMYAIDR